MPKPGRKPPCLRSLDNRIGARLDTFIGAYNFARRLKALKGLTPFEYICKIWTI